MKSDPTKPGPVPPGLTITYWATACGRGPFRPALTDGHEVWVIGDLSYGTEEEANRAAGFGYAAMRRAVEMIAGTLKLTRVKE